MIDDAVRQRWEREQAFLGLTRETPDGEFARGGLGTLAGDPTVRITVLPDDPSSQALSPEDPKTVIPQTMKMPRGRHWYHGAVRGTSSGYVGFTTGNDGRWECFSAVNWHGGVDFMLGAHGGRQWSLSPNSQVRVVFLLTCVGSMSQAFDLQRQVVERFRIAGPFRAILSVADTVGAVLGDFGAGWAEPTDGFAASTAVEPRVLLLEDLSRWPDEADVEALALKFGARLDLAFGGSGQRHLDREGPEVGKFNPGW